MAFVPSSESDNLRRNGERRSVGQDRDIYVIENSTLAERAREEKLRRRLIWQIEQDREKRHERMKRDKIEEYERNRARELARKNRVERSKYRDRSRNESECTSRRDHSDDDSSIESVVLHTGSRCMQIKSSELREIIVYVRGRKSEGSNVVFQRDVVVKRLPSLIRDVDNAEDVILKRREEEGCQSIFNRREIKRGIQYDVEEVLEKRTSTAAGPTPLERANNLTHANNERKQTAEARKERIVVKNFEQLASTSRRQKRQRSRHSSLDRSRSSSRESCYCKAHGRTKPRERSRENRDRMKSNGYTSHIPVPIYYASVPLTPLMVTPVVSLTGQGLPMGQVPLVGQVPPCVRQVPSGREVPSVGQVPSSSFCRTSSFCGKKRSNFNSTIDTAISKFQRVQSGNSYR